MPRCNFIQPDPERRCGGCLKLDDHSRALLASAKATAVSFRNAWEVAADGALPVIEYNHDFETFLDERAEKIEQLRNVGKPTLPWEILACVSNEQRKSGRLFINQGARDSCANHALDHAFCASMLYEIALGSPLIYESFNGIYGHYVSKGNVMAGGQTIPATADFVNRHGLYPESLVGEDNQSVPRDYAQFEERVKTWQAAVIYLGDTDLAEKITRCNKGGIGVALGNSLAVAGDKTDKNGVPIPILSGYWGHATAFIGYQIVNAAIYLFWINSHGEIYTSYLGGPKSGLWMTQGQLEEFLRSASVFGDPFAIGPRAVLRKDYTLHV